jgi:ABC-type phosphate/phosphonate transport system ATPase subunit
MNKNLSQIARQLAAIWQQLGLSQRISVIAATVVVLAGRFERGFYS